MGWKTNNTKHPLYCIWNGIKQRCNNKSSVAYRLYGGRGIYVCARWMNSFTDFIADMGPRPEGYSIERIDNDGPYSPNNCHWATRKEQTKNTRHNRHFTVGGITLTYMEWCDRAGVKYSTFGNRLRLGWSVEQALGMLPAPSKRTAANMPHGWLEMLRKTNLPRETVIWRVRRGWTFERAISTPKGKYTKPTARAYSDAGQFEDYRLGLRARISVK